jgi:hypothetical protein
MTLGHTEVSKHPCRVLLASGEEPLGIATLLAPAAEEGAWPETDEPSSAASFAAASSAALLFLATSTPTTSATQ